jgi:hypothetical protein
MRFLCSDASFSTVPLASLVHINPALPAFCPYLRHTIVPQSTHGVVGFFLQLRLGGDCA